MKKETILHVVLRIIFLLVFNVFFFVIFGIHHLVSVWIAYGFIHFSYIMFVLISKIFDDDFSTYELKLSNKAISLVYFIFTVTECIIFIILKMTKYKLCLLINVFVTGTYFMILIINTLVNNQTAIHADIHENELKYIKDSTSKLRFLMEMRFDKNIERQLQNLYDLIHSSPTKSDESIYYYEQKVLTSINILSEELRSNNFSNIDGLIESIRINASERNRILGLLNRT